jgi:hypothetical protein
MSMVDLVATRRDTIGPPAERYTVSGTDSTTIDTERQTRTATCASAHARAGVRRAAVVPRCQQWEKLLSGPGALQLCAGV